MRPSCAPSSRWDAASGMEVIAEGVESRRQLEFLRSNDCQYGQGRCSASRARREELLALLAPRPPARRPLRTCCARPTRPPPARPEVSACFPRLKPAFGRVHRRGRPLYDGALAAHRVAVRARRLDRGRLAPGGEAAAAGAACRLDDLRAARRRGDVPGRHHRGGCLRAPGREPGDLRRGAAGGANRAALHRPRLFRLRGGCRQRQPAATP